MPSPIGHAIAGATIAWAFAPRRPSWHLTPSPALTPGLTLACVALAVAPDLDLIVPQGHRMATHSVAAVALVTILAIAVTGKVTGRIRWRVIAACVAAYASHLFLDWLAADPTTPRGIRLLWPFSDGWYISNWDLFRGTARLDIFTMQSMRINALAIAQEILLLGPIALAVRMIQTSRERGAR